MKFHVLLKLEQMVLEKLSPGGSLCLEADRQVCLSLLAKIQRDVKMTFGLVGFASIKKEVFARHLDQLYKQCRNLSDTLHAYGSGQGLQGELRAEVQGGLLKLLDDLPESHDDLLNPALPVSALQLATAVAALEAELGRMVSLMKQYHVDAALQAIIVSKISKLRDKTKVGWSQLRHLEQVVRYIKREFNGRFSNGNAYLCNFLQRSNFNTEAFLLYCKSEIDKLLENEPDQVEAYSRLCDLEKKYKTAYYRKNALPYEPRMPQVRTVLLEYVRAEMDCRRKKNRGMARPVIVVNTAQAGKTEAVAADPSGEKLMVSISVDVLVCFFRLLISTGVVCNPTKASVLRFLSAHVETPGAADRNISLKSLENKYRQLTNSSLNATRGILVKMLKQLEEECA